jgi:hypothetical protein
MNFKISPGLMIMLLSNKNFDHIGNITKAALTASMGAGNI